MEDTASEIIGLGGALLAGYAYLPQVTHLVRERCAAGLSERAFALWLMASLLMTVHAVTIGAVVFIVLGIQQVAATALIAFYCRLYRGQPCPSHAPVARSPQRSVPWPAPVEPRPFVVAASPSPGLIVLDGQIVGG
ncbi:MAG: PQ-loop domain-containing transporter [Acidimicrobiales bacterium]